MTEEADFIRQICLTPDDDAPRLIFADWLDEHDRGEQAAAIRTHIESFRKKSLANNFLNSGFVRSLLGDAVVEKISKHSTKHKTKHNAKGNCTIEITCSTNYGDKMSVSICRGFVDSMRCDFWFWGQVGADIAKCQPCSVLFTDSGEYKPANIGNSDGLNWAWLSDNYNGDESKFASYLLPNEIWKRLRGKKHNEFWKCYKTRESAIAGFWKAIERPFISCDLQPPQRSL